MVNFKYILLLIFTTMSIFAHAGINSIYENPYYVVPYSDVDYSPSRPSNNQICQNYVNYANKQYDEGSHYFGLNLGSYVEFDHTTYVTANQFNCYYRANNNLSHYLDGDRPNQLFVHQLEVTPVCPQIYLDGFVYDDKSHMCVKEQRFGPVCDYRTWGSSAFAKGGFGKTKALACDSLNGADWANDTTVDNASLVADHCEFDLIQNRKIVGTSSTKYFKKVNCKEPTDELICAPNEHKEGDKCVYVPPCLPSELTLDDNTCVPLSDIEETPSDDAQYREPINIDVDVDIEFVPAEDIDPDNSDPDNSDPDNSDTDNPDTDNPDPDNPNSDDPICTENQELVNGQCLDVKCAGLELFINGKCEPIECPVDYTYDPVSELCKLDDDNLLDDSTDSPIECDANGLTKKMCDWMDWTQRPPPVPVNTNVDIVDKSKDIVLDENRYQFESSCPPDYDIDVNTSIGSKTITVKYGSMCEFLAKMAPFNKGAAYIYAVFILTGIRARAGDNG